MPVDESFSGRNRPRLGTDLDPAPTMNTTVKVSRNDTGSLGSMHIAFVVPALFGNGAERTVLEIACELIDRGHRVDFLLFRSVIDRPEDIPSALRFIVLKHRFPGSLNPNVSRLLATRQFATLFLPGEVRLASCWRFLRALKLHPLTLPNIGMFEDSQFVANYASEEMPDCIVSLLPKGKVATLLARTLHRAFPPIISFVHNDMGRRRRREIARYRRLFSLSDHFIAVSEGVRSSIARAIRIPSEKITTIYNPVVTPALTSLASHTPDHPWLRHRDSRVILAAGRLSDVKDFPTLLRAVRRVVMSLPIRLIILGEGRQRGKLEALVRGLKLEDCVSLPGYVENPYAFMSRASLFVLSSKFEGLANVLIEALACGCPCVSTDCPSGPSEILDRGMYGPLVPVGDHIALADAIVRVLESPPDKEFLMKRALDFSSDTSVSKFEEVISSVVFRRHGFVDSTSEFRERGSA